MLVLGMDGVVQSIRHIPSIEIFPIKFSPPQNPYPSKPPREAGPESIYDLQTDDAQPRQSLPQTTQKQRLRSLPPISPTPVGFHPTVCV